MTATIIPNGSQVPAIPTALTPGCALALFRAKPNALARPGTTNRRPGTANWRPSAKREPLAEHVPAGPRPLLALADLSTPACVVDTSTRPAWPVDSQIDGQTSMPSGNWPRG